MDHLILGGLIYNTFLCAKYGVKIKGVEVRLFLLIVYLKSFQTRCAWSDVVVRRSCLFEFAAIQKYPVVLKILLQFVCLVQDSDIVLAKDLVEQDRNEGKILELPYVVESDTLEGRIEGKFRTLHIKVNLSYFPSLSSAEDVSI